MRLKLESQGIRLRKLKVSDAKFLYQNAKDREVTKYTFVIPSPIGLKKAEKFIRKTHRE